MTKFESQAQAGKSGNPPSLIPALWNIGILLHKTKYSILFCTRLYVNFGRFKPIINNFAYFATVANKCDQSKSNQENRSYDKIGQFSGFQKQNQYFTLDNRVEEHVCRLCLAWISRDIFSTIICSFTEIKSKTKCLPDEYLL